LSVDQAADKADATDDGVLVIVTAARSYWLPSLSALAHSHHFPWQSMLAVCCPHSRCFDVAAAGGGLLLCLRDAAPTAIIIVAAAPTILPLTLYLG